jgi:integrase
VRTVTADRTRNRIQLVLDFAVARGHRSPGVNPAAWSQLKHAGLAQPTKAAPVEHHAAVPYAEVPAVMAELQRHEGVSAMALQFCILTAARAGEVLGATWSEIDLDNALWTIPKERMKRAREHRVALSPHALDLLRNAYREDDNDFVFIGTSKANLSAKAMLMLLQRIGQADMTVHGFRSSFADWAHERTSFPGHAIEISLAHKVGDATEQAYRRSDLFNKRVTLMREWGKYCTSPPRRATGNVTPLRAVESAS